MRNKLPIYAHPSRQLRPPKYKPLPDGWEWPPLPYPNDLDLKPRTKKKRKRIPIEVPQEYAAFRQPRAQSSQTQPKNTAEASNAERHALAEDKHNPYPEEADSRDLDMDAGDDIPDDIMAEATGPGLDAA